MNDGLLLPTEYNNEEPKITYYDRKINMLRVLLSNFTLRPPNFPGNDVIQTVIGSRTHAGSARIRQVYMRYYENIPTYALSYACDSYIDLKYLTC